MILSAKPGDWETTATGRGNLKPVRYPCPPWFVPQPCLARIACTDAIGGAGGAEARIVVQTVVRPVKPQGSGWGAFLV